MLGTSSPEPTATARVMTRWLRSPAVASAIAVALISVFVAVRLVELEGDASRFVVAGLEYVDPEAAPSSLSVLPGYGYDGQFFYRLGLDPADLRAESHGIHFDLSVRLARIGYPVLAWLASAGQADALPWAMILLNIAAIGLLAYLGALAAREAGRHELWGLLIAAFPGFVFAVARDLSEVLAASALLAGLLLYRRGRPVSAGLALAIAVLTRETAALVVVAIAFMWLLRSKRARDALAWALPLVAFIGWEMVVKVSAAGVFPLRGDGSNLAAPFSGILPELVDWLGDPFSKAVLLRLAIFLLVVSFLVLAAWSLRRSSAWPHEKLAFAFLLVLAVCLSRSVYVDPADFRVLGELWVVAALILLTDPQRNLVPAGLGVGIVASAEAIYRMVVV